MAESSDGLHFTMRPAITKTSYLRVVPYQGAFYGLSRLGQVLRAADPLATFEPGPQAFRGGTYANRVRHLALIRRGSRLHVDEDGRLTLFYGTCGEQGIAAATLVLP